MSVKFVNNRLASLMEKGLGPLGSGDHDRLGCPGEEVVSMLFQRSTPNDQEFATPSRSNSPAHSIVGTVGLILAAVIIARTGWEPTEDSSKDLKVASRAVLRWRESPVFNLAWSPDGGRLAASSFGPIIRVW